MHMVLQAGARRCPTTASIHAQWPRDDSTHLRVHTVLNQGHADAERLLVQAAVQQLAELKRTLQSGHTGGRAFSVASAAGATAESWLPVRVAVELQLPS